MDLPDSAHRVMEQNLYCAAMSKEFVTEMFKHTLFSITFAIMFLMIYLLPLLLQNQDKL